MSFSSSKSGIALLEIVFATAIAGIALITLGISISRCIHGVVAADKVQGAIDVVQSRLAEWEVLVSEEDRIPTGSEEGEKNCRNQKYFWKQEIEALEDSQALQLHITVHWNEGNLERQWKFACIYPESLKKAHEAEPH